MTRINCLPVHELTDQHLLAEYREITRVAKLARKLPKYNKYVMGTGHIKFFYNKGEYLAQRTEQLYQECIKRGYDVQHKQYKLHLDGLNQNWLPSVEDEMVCAARINDKLDNPKRPYTYYRAPILPSLRIP